jgi:hypothetical protein
MSDGCQRADIPPPVDFIWAKSSVDSKIAVERCDFGPRLAQGKMAVAGSQLLLQSCMTNPGSQC